MSTRLYCPTTCPSTVTPPTNGTWDFTTGALNRFLSTTKTNSANANGATIGPWTPGQKALDRYYVTAPLKGAQLVTGTVKAYRQALESSGGHVRTRLEVYVISRDGATVRGTALAIGEYGVAADLNTSLRNKSWAVAGTSLTDVVAQDGDRIVVGIGYSDSSGATPSAHAQYGDVTATADMAENETATTGEGWIEFSATLSFWQVAISRLETVNGSGTSLTGGAQSPTAGRLQIIFAFNQIGSGTIPNVPTIITTTNLTFDLLGSTVVVNGTNRFQLAVFRALSSSPGTGTVKVDFAGQSQTNIHFYWHEAAGVDQSGVNGQGAVRQFLIGNTGGVNTTTITLSYGALLPDNTCFAAWGFSTTGVTETAKSGWTTYANNGTGLSSSVDWRPNADPTPSAVGTWSTSQFPFGAALELQFGDVPGVVVPHRLVACQAVQRAAFY